MTKKLSFLGRRVRHEKTGLTGIVTAHIEYLDSKRNPDVCFIEDETEIQPKKGSGKDSIGEWVNEKEVFISPPTL